MRRWNALCTAALLAMAPAQRPRASEPGLGRSGSRDLVLGVVRTPLRASQNSPQVSLLQRRVQPPIGHRPSELRGDHREWDRRTVV